MLIPEILAANLLKELYEIDDPEDATGTLYETICDYVEEHGKANYLWVGTNPVSGVTETLNISAEIDTGLGGIVGDLAGITDLKPSGASTTTEALSFLVRDLIARCSLWKIDWPEDFQLTPAFIIPTMLTGLLVPSLAESQIAALEDFSVKFLAGIRLATPGATGIHITGGFEGAATFLGIV